MRIERDETAKAYFDKIIDDFASIKARKALFRLSFLVIKWRRLDISSAAKNIVREGPVNDVSR